MHNNTAKTIENRRETIRKATANGTAAMSRFSPKRSGSQHGLLKGPYYPLISNLPIPQGT